MKTLFDDIAISHQTGVGASSAGAVMNIGFGCKRRLWYSTRSETPDYPKAETPEFERGHMIEPVIRELYTKKTGRKVILKDMARHPDYPYMIVHVDGEVTAPERAGPGYFEAKCVNRFVFKKFKKEGIRDEYILQLQHGMAVMGYQWGSFGILCLDPWEFAWFDVDRDEDLIQKLIEEEGAFWALIENGPAPEPLPNASDKRCQICEYRRTCRQAEMVPETTSDDLQQRNDLAPLLTEVTELSGLKDEATELYEEKRTELKTAIGDAYGIIAPGFRAYYPTSYPERWDTKALDSLVKEAKNLLTQAPIDYDELEIAYQKAVRIIDVLAKAKAAGKPQRSLRIYATGD